MDADFLAFYGIDLDDCDLSGPRFLALAYRTYAYDGVMARRAQLARAEAAEEQPVGEPARRVVGGEPLDEVGIDPNTRRGVAAYHEQRGETDVNVVSLSAFRSQFPGVIG